MTERPNAFFLWGGLLIAVASLTLLILQVTIGSHSVIGILAPAFTALLGVVLILSRNRIRGGNTDRK